MAAGTDCTTSPLFGLWKPQDHLASVYYGAGCVEKHLLGSLPAGPSSSVFIVTGRSLAKETPLVRRLEELLGTCHAGTYDGIRQHGQEDGVDEATERVLECPSVDVVLSLGGGSPIDAAKTVCFRVQQQSSSGRKLTHISIPTTLSAAECTAGGGFTRRDGTKVGMMHASMGVSVIFYDALFAAWTPPRLWLSTGVRAVDHAVEAMYHPRAAEVPWKALAVWAFGVLVEGLPRAKELHGSPEDDDESRDGVTTELQLAAFASSALRGANFAGGMGLSHSLGHAIGSPYGIPHGETSCLTLAPVIRHKARTDAAAASQVARLLPAAGGRRCSEDESGSGSGSGRSSGSSSGSGSGSGSGSSSRSDQADALQVAQRVEDLVMQLGLAQPSLSSRGVTRDQVAVIAAKVSAGGAHEEGLVALIEGFFS